MVADDVAPGCGHALSRLRVQVKPVGPEIRRARLLHTDSPRELEHLLHERGGHLAAPVVARLVPDVPEEDAVVVLVLLHHFAAHLEKPRTQHGVVRADIADRSRETSVLAPFATAVVADVVGLRARLRHRPHLLRTRTVVAETHNGANLVLAAQVEETLEVAHVAGAVFAPHGEAVVLRDDHAHGVEADGFGEGEFAVHLLETPLAVPNLPHVVAVRRARRHVVASADPRLRVVPLPRLLLRPRSGTRRGTGGE